MRETKSEVIKLIAFVANLVLITSNVSQFSWTFDLRASYCFDRTDSCSSEGGGLHNLLKENRLDGAQKSHWAVSSRESCALQQGPMCRSTAFLLDLSTQKKNFLSPEDNLLCSHPPKPCDCEWHG